MDEESKKKILVIVGALIIVLTASLLFIGRDMEITTYGWFIVSSVYGFICGVSLIKEDFSKIAIRYLLIIFVVSFVMIGITSSYWMHTCFGIFVPIILVFAPPLAFLVGRVIGLPILNLIIYLINLGRKKEENQNIELQN